MQTIILYSHFYYIIIDHNNIIVTVITNVGNTVQNMLTMQRNAAKVIVFFSERELPLM